MWIKVKFGTNHVTYKRFPNLPKSPYVQIGLWQKSIGFKNEIWNAYKLQIVRSNNVVF